MNYRIRAKNWFGEKSSLIIKCIISKLQSIRDSLLRKQEVYCDLAPISDIDKVDPKGKYRDALYYAVKNKEIRNFAITGPYGSGKSSLIKSYIDYGPIKKDKYLIISLSTFENKCKIRDTPINTIEASILEQIIYRNEENTHRYSRLNSINAPKRKRIVTHYLKILFFILTVTYAISDTIRGLIGDYFNLLSNFIRSDSVLISFLNHSMVKAALVTATIIINVSIFYGFYKELRVLAKITMKFNKIEFEVDKSDNSSLLDRYVDEIYNFFKHNRYDIVIFEDLDRYCNIDIFERLKRINRILNHSYTIIEDGRVIKFVYAIGDHLFQNNSYKERTKFFDFVIPVVPIIDSTNSYHEIKNTFDSIEICKKPDERLLKDVSIFVDDMRTLKNIINEYILQYGLLYETENDIHFANKIFAFSCFKNRYPREFANLQKNQGEFIDLIGFYKDTKKRKQSEIYEEIKKIENQLQNSDSELNIDLNELDDLYKLFLFRLIGGRTGGNTCVFYKGNRVIRNYYNKDEVFSDNNIGQLMDADYFTISGDGKQHKIKDFLTLGGRSLPYKDRIKSIELKNLNTRKDISRELVDLRIKLRDIGHATLKEIINENESEEEVINFKTKYPLLFYLIYNKHIAEDYKRYLSFFKEGHLSRADLEFISAIKSRQKLEFDFTIDNPKEICAELVIDDLTSEYILNFNLIKYMLDHDNQTVIIIIESFYNKKKIFLDFINEYLNQTGTDLKEENSIRRLLQLMYKNWDDLWVFLVGQKNIFKNSEVGLIKYALISVIDMEDFYEYESKNNEVIMGEIERHDNLIELLDFVSKEKVIRALEKYIGEGILIENFKFALTALDKHKSLVEFIYKNSLYKLNLSNIISVLNMVTCENRDIYSLAEIVMYLQGDDVRYLKEYIENNTPKFVDIMSNEFDNEEIDSMSLEYLLNVIAQDDGDTNKILDILTEEFKVSDITSINQEYWEAIVEKNKIVPTINNVLNYIELKGVNPLIYLFIELNRSGLIEDKDSFVDNMMKTIYKILRYEECQLDVLTVIREIISNEQININYIKLSRSNIIKIFKAKFKIEQDDELLFLLNSDDDLMKEYMIAYYNEILNGKIEITIKPKIVSEIIRNEELETDFALRMLLINDNDNDYFENAVSLLISDLSNRHIINFIKMTDNKDYKEIIVSNVAKLEKFNVDFIFDCIKLIDPEYEVFSLKKMFAIEGSIYFENLLKMLEGRMISSVKRHDNGKLHVYLKG